MLQSGIQQTRMLQEYKLRATGYVSILILLCHSFADFIFVLRLDWITPGSTSFSKCAIILFPECSIGLEIQFSQFLADFCDKSNELFIRKV